MSDCVSIPKVAPSHRSSGGWFVYDDGRGSQPHLVCGGCGKHAGRLIDHAVEVGGIVTPSIVCPHPNCGWHVWGRLDGWAHGRKAPGASVAP